MENQSSRMNFWAYDIFGYLLPGLILMAGFAKANSEIYSAISAHWVSGNYADYVIILGIAYTLGHFISGLSSFLLERLLLRHILKYPTDQMFKEHDDTSDIIKVFFPGYFRPYSSEFQNLVKMKIRGEYNLQSTQNHDLFWIAWSYICLHHPIAYRRATHFLELYGFSRNMSMCFFMLITATWFPQWTGTMNGWIWSCGSLFIAWILFVNYTKLLRRLNDEVYRAFVVAKPQVIA